MFLIDIPKFISEHITMRSETLFQSDLEQHREELVNGIQGRSVLVIGGAGTIGSAFIKALLPFKPGRLYVVDINENGLTELTRDLRSDGRLHLPEDYKTYPINFGGVVFSKLLQREGPFEIVANFAAHKHVRSEKDQYSIEAMLENNVLYNWRLLQLLQEQRPERFFCVSTDKAANPVNVMGASKKLMEELLLAHAAVLPVTTARFANVAFSNGSLPAGFIERLAKRQPFSAPLDVKRYFVSPEESGQLCLLACMLGESGEILFPKLQEEQMVRFSDIGSSLLRELGYKPVLCDTEAEAREQATSLDASSNTYPVYYFVSDTSGEKPYEEFFTKEELVIWDRFQALGVVKAVPNRTPAQLEVLFTELQSLLSNALPDKQAIVSLLANWIPGFEHIEKGKNLDERM